MKTTIRILTLLATAGIAFAQGPRGPHPGSGTGMPGLDMSKSQTVAGAVTAVNIGYGIEYPSITVNKVQVKLGPVWYLLDKGFEVKVGDAVTAVAAPSLAVSDAYLHAIEITNSASNVSIVLRDPSGVPIWTGRGSPNAPAGQGGCVDTASIGTASGTVDNVIMGAGIQMPALTVKTGDGKLVVIKIGPERLLLASDIELKPGDTVSVKYAQTCTGELVALALTTSAGKTVTLRDDDGTPAWR